MKKTQTASKIKACNKVRDKGCSAVVEHLPSLYGILGSVLNIENNPNGFSNGNIFYMLCDECFLLKGLVLTMDLQDQVLRTVESYLPQRDTGQ